MNFPYSFQFTPLVPQGSDTIWADFSGGELSTIPILKFAFSFIKFVIGWAKKKAG